MAEIDNVGISSIEDALEAVRRGEFLVVMDNEDRENEGDLIMPAEMATEESLAFMIRYSSGVICAPAMEDRIQQLQLPLMVPDNTEARKCKFTVSVDLIEGTSTGISASDRARTIRAMADPNVKGSDFNKPGHVFPLVAVRAGVIGRAGHTEAGVDIARLAGFQPVGYLCEINDDHGRMMRRDELQQFSKLHNLHMITISDLIRYRFTHERLVSPGISKTVHTIHGPAQLLTYTSNICQSTFEAVVFSLNLVQNASNVVVHLVEPSAHGNIIAQYAQEMIAKQGCGVLIYMHNEQDKNHISGKLMASQSNFGMAVQILSQLNIQSATMLHVQDELGFDTKGFGMAINIQRMDIK